jgi:MoxR-like ATPase
MNLADRIAAAARMINDPRARRAVLDLAQPACELQQERDRLRRTLEELAQTALAEAMAAEACNVVQMPLPRPFGRRG